VLIAITAWFYPQEVLQGVYRTLVVSTRCGGYRLHSYSVATGAVMVFKD
jgi:hypothetical protein